MDNFNEEEWETIALIKEKEREKEIETIKRLEYLASIPFHKRMQEKGQEEHLERLKQISLDVFKHKGIIKEYNFEDYWNSFLENGISINKWIEAKNEN